MITPLRYHFNPRSPHGERRVGKTSLAICMAFQSTLPARGATQCTRNHPQPRQFQSTLPARGATTQSIMRARGGYISIHAPRTGSDATDGRCTTIAEHFNPRSPHGERPHCPRLGGIRRGISIHAPRTGSDWLSVSIVAVVSGFQSTLPARGATDAVSASKTSILVFQSTLPARGATAFSPPDFDPLVISIHAPRTGSDRR